MLDHYLRRELQYNRGEVKVSFPNDMFRTSYPEEDGVTYSEEVFARFLDSAHQKWLRKGGYVFSGVVGATYETIMTLPGQYLGKAQDEARELLRVPRARVVLGEQHIAELEKLIARPDPVEEAWFDQGNTLYEVSAL